ncbi:integrase core domain-containing protein [Actinopolymorpha pittospori]|uniref:integrase core domain-containing protein n=1 Tax=Actinopolymorpha pittospori TaxID=648752 RepID=UPI003B58726C
MVHSRSPSWLIPAASHDGFSADVHHHGSFTTAARGGLAPVPVYRYRRTYLHLCNSMVTADHSAFYNRKPQLPSGHTNAMAESFFAALKNERVHRTQYPTRAHAYRDIARYIELRYNSVRRHSGLQYRTPKQVYKEYLNRQLAA